ncbi:MAG TPA: response regulator transcription factor [Aggregatilineales bacterium]|nr:response regulator transcription factor [Anaerolineales bacterium]HRE49139.1 response regulator transcription factor [Aggregatilineales bacterium]
MTDGGSTLDRQDATILVVDDDGAARYAIRRTLERAGYDVEEAVNGEQALLVMEGRPYDVVISDIRMPDISGVELLARIKDRSPEAVVILMTGFSSLPSAVEALRLGAHDYLMKPVSNSDLRQSVARGVMRAMNIRRRQMLLESIKQNVALLIDVERAVKERPSNGVPPPPITVPPPTVVIGPLTLFPGHYRIQIGEESLNLTPTEFDLFLYLAAHRGRVVPCHELVREVRGYLVEENEAREVIRPHISNLRRKLEDAGQDPDLIDNVRGVGYRLNTSNEETV